MSQDAENMPMVGVTGLRGVPGVQGGIESHVQNLYEKLADRGIKAVIYARKPFMHTTQIHTWHGLSVKPLWSPRRTGVEALVHTAYATARAKLDGVQLLHVHGIGPALITPIARLLGMDVVVTHHGRDYEREKWGTFARWLLKTGERLACQYANAVICVSRADMMRLREEYPARQIERVPNGAPQMVAAESTTILSDLGLNSGKYLLNVARLVPEKRQLDLIQAFAKIQNPDWKLVLVGSAQNESEYPTQVASLANETPNCVLAGARSGAELSTLYANAGVFVLPSAHEGLPVTLLEALSFGLLCAASDIPANRELDLPVSSYFPVGDILSQTRCLLFYMSQQDSKKEAKPAVQSVERLPAEYQWDSVASQTIEILKRVSMYSCASTHQQLISTHQPRSPEGVDDPQREKGDEHVMVTENDEKGSKRPIESCASRSKADHIPG